MERFHNSQQSSTWGWFHISDVEAVLPYSLPLVLVRKNSMCTLRNTGRSSDKARPHFPNATRLRGSESPRWEGHGRGQGLPGAGEVIFLPSLKNLSSRFNSLLFCGTRMSLTVKDPTTTPFPPMHCPQHRAAYIGP